MRVVSAISLANTRRIGPWVQICTAALGTTVHCPAPVGDEKDVVNQAYVKQFVGSTPADGAVLHALQFVGRPWLDPRLIQRGGGHDWID